MRTVVAVSMIIVLTACGGGGGGSGGGPVVNEPIQPAAAPDYSELEVIQADDSSLRRALSAREFEDSIRNGLRLMVRDGVNIRPPAVPAAGESDDSPPVDGSPPAAGEFSETNVQVQGVDEGDLVKYDGRYLYIYQPQGYGSPDLPDSPRLRVVATDPESARAMAVAELDLGERDRDVRELYLVEGNGGTAAVAAISQSWQVYALDDVAFDAPVADSASGLSIWGPDEISTRIELVDVDDPANPAVGWTLEFDGTLEGSRKIGNMLYLVSRYNTVPRDIDFYPATDEERIALEEQIATLPVAELLPRYRINGGDEQLLTDPLDCLVPGSLKEGQGLLDIVTVTAIDLAARRISNSLCMNTPVSGIYSSTGNLYIGASLYPYPVAVADGEAALAEEMTAIHKIGLTSEGVSYRASGTVKGVLGWDKSQFRMDEFNGDLRVVTTQYNTEQPRHRLSILREDGAGRLQVIAGLPSNSQPDPIGKPGEDIYAVRFFGARAFIVTFRRIDPLYTLDLSDPLAPRIAGALEIPGFSSYLHPVNDRWLLAVGYDVENNRSAGIKIELFDTSGASARSVGYASYGKAGTWSPAVYDHRALSFLPVDSGDSLRFALPINVADTPVDWSDDYYDWSATRLHLFTVEGVNGDAASLVSNGAVLGASRSETRPYPQDYPEGRSVLHGDAVFYIYNAGVLSAFWDAPGEAVAEGQ